MPFPSRSDSLVRSWSVFLLAIGAALVADAKQPAVTGLRISPGEVLLGGANRQQQLLVTAETADGTELDVTHEVAISLADERIARNSSSAIHGVSDGETMLLVEYRGVKSSVPVRVADFDIFPTVHFRTDVMPLLSKLGCNSGGCHGKQSGQNGFKLSVFGFDPRADFDALTREARGRRVFPGDPGRSLLVRKATGVVPHGGGARTDIGSADAEILTNWIQQGASWGGEHAVVVEKVRIEPSERILAAHSRQQILVTALYSDGSSRDVTFAASYTSNAAIVAEADRRGLVRTGTTPGEASITINYMGHVGAARVIVPREADAASFTELPSNNRVDEFVGQRLRKLNVPASGLCDDASFLRRVFLDTIGTLPTGDEAREFHNSNDPTKRRKAIDNVLQRGEFADFWALKWSDILMVNQDRLGERGAFEFHRWLREQIAANRPYDEWVTELLTSSGNSGKYGPVNFYRAMRTPEDLTKAVSQAFLGIRMDCAQCHHHPFEKWAQEDFYAMAGFFNGIQRKQLSESRELVFHTGLQPASLPLTGEKVQVRAPDGPRLNEDSDDDPRAQLARWMTSAENPYFARLVANRLWKNFMGRGLVEPEDDLRSTNPATNEPLLKFLADQVVANDFDLKAIMRLIMNSRVYQLSSAANPANADDDRNYSRFIVRRLPAETLLDAISQVTDSDERFVGMPAGTRAIQLWDNRLPSYFLDTFGRSLRESPCECGKSGEPTMAQALHLMNAPEIDAKIADPRGRVAQLIASKKSADEIVEELCFVAFGRPPVEKERRVAKRLFARQAKQQAAEDFLWTILNSYDFLFIQ